MNDTIIKALNWRYAVQKFDPIKQVSEADVHTILESARLAPSSDGMEPWKFIVVQNQEIRQKISEAGYGQPKITEAPVLIAVTYRTDPDALPSERVARIAKAQKQTMGELKDVLAYYQGGIAAKKARGFEAWSKAQSYIPLGIMLETAALLGVDAGPMEGFDPERVDHILGLPQKNLKVATLLALGYRAEEPARPKSRREFDEVVEYRR